MDKTILKKYNNLASRLSRKYRRHFKPIYTISVFNYTANDKGVIYDMEIDFVGYFHNRKYAELAVKNNTFDMHELCYKWAIIEKLYPGVYGNSEDRQFYCWDDDNAGYIACEAPALLKNCSNFH